MDGSLDNDQDSAANGLDDDGDLDDDQDNIIDLDDDRGDLEGDEDILLDERADAALQCLKEWEGSPLEDSSRALRDDANIQALHAVIRCIFLKEERDPVEQARQSKPCADTRYTFVQKWLALSNLLSDGSFKPSNICAQEFSKITYHIRSAILVEALLSDIQTGSPLQYVSASWQLLTLKPFFDLLINLGFFFI